MLRKDKLHPYFVWFLGASFFLVDYIIRVSPSVLTHELMRTFNVNAFAVGLFSGYFYYAYISMQIPVGILVDKFGPKRLLVVSVLICSLSVFMFSNTDSISIGYLSRVLMGLGASFAFVGTLKLISIWFSARRFALLAGITQAMGMLGAMIGQGPMSHWYDIFGWRQCMHSLGIFFILLCIFIYVFVKDENHYLDDHDVDSAHTVKVIPALKSVLTNTQSWLNCLFVGLMYAPTACFGEQWGAPFLSVHQHISITTAGQETGILFIGLALGCPVLGWLSDYFNTRVLIMRISVVLCLVALTTIIYGHANAAWTIALLFAYGFFNSGIVVSYAMASEINSRQYTGIALGISNMSSVILGAIMIPIVGWLLDHLWSGNIQNGIHVFAPHTFKLAFIALPLGLISAFVITFFQRDTKQLTV